MRALRWRARPRGQFLVRRHRVTRPRTEPRVAGDDRRRRRPNNELIGGDRQHPVDIVVRPARGDDAANTLASGLDRVIVRSHRVVERRRRPHRDRLAEEATEPAQRLDDEEVDR
jgi:hypothetical protein